METMNNAKIMEQFKNLFNEIVTVENKIQDQIKLKNNYVITNANPIFNEVMEKINTTIKILDSIFPLEKISKLLNIDLQIKSTLINYNKYSITVRLNFKYKICELFFRKNETEKIYSTFFPIVTEKETWQIDFVNKQRSAYSLSCDQFIEIFGDTKNIYIILDLFKNIIQDIINQLEEKLNKLQKELKQIVIFNIKDSEDDNNQSIILGELDGYQVILQKKGDDK